MELNPQIDLQLSDALLAPGQTSGLRLNSARVWIRTAGGEWRVTKQMSLHKARRVYEEAGSFALGYAALLGLLDLHPRIAEAALFAENAHGVQQRKYTGEPYIVHPLSVAALVTRVTTDLDQIIAAILHDVVEDTQVTIEEIEGVFGPVVSALVSDLTDVSLPSDGNRRVRKGIDREHTAQASAGSKTIKLADLIENSSTILAHDPNFAKVYMGEKRELLDVLREGDPVLYGHAQDIVRGYFR